MEIFMTLQEAKCEGLALANRGRFPTIYKRGISEYILTERGEWPPQGGWPFLKYDGDDWVPILKRLNSIGEAQEACSLFRLLGHQPIIAQFPGVCFDIFMQESHVPTGAWILLESEEGESQFQLQTPRFYDEEEDDDEIILDIKSK
jgi:hypothetical protein